ncbi:LiaF transmembrane domain-containing protein [Pengzhenrongella frigida]|uniref:LiaF transmembrane domain-containing protein n=1 Tax=Pengzhenrongella frigida TaxID=1259133 RepID=A0A4Q5N0Q3_9MICO|nr:DUF5668 domain-containing protein [Cellulomonas sp. HLT2-17]RYV50803.1 hypothetical protein EUA98_11675 [Cellulomonas sp. HLT2-17]
MNRRPLPQIVLGVVIVVVGVVGLLRAMGLVDLSLDDLFSTWWPLAIILVGLAALVAAPRAWIGPTLIVTVGLLFQLDNLDLLDVAVGELLWPLVIIFVGLSLLTNLGTRGTDDRTINSAVIWWGSARRTTSQQFEGGSLSAIMGGIEVDLRQAGLADGAEISVFTFWGGVEIKVPPTWRVQVSGLPVLGGWENKTVPPADPEAPVLTVHVTAIMGGVEIKAGD